MFTNCKDMKNIGTIALKNIVDLFFHAGNALQQKGFGMLTMGNEKASVGKTRDLNFMVGKIYLGFSVRNYI